MCQLQIQPHLFNPLDSHKIDIEAGQTLSQVLADLTPDYQDSPVQPIIARVNGKLADPISWHEHTLNTGDTVVISPRPFGFETVAAIFALASTAYSYVQMRKMKGMQKDYRDLPEQSPTYDTNAQGNSARLGQPVPVGYGNHIVWPDFAAQPYRRYENGKQYLYCLFAIGQGEYQLSQRKIGNTAFDRFEEIEEQLCGPGVRVDLFSPDVLTSAEVSNLDLYASNDEKYQGWSGPYAVCPADVKCKRIELDFILNGLYEQDDSGDLVDATVSAEAHYRALDDDGVPSGDWLSLIAQDFTDNTVDVLRFTVGKDVALGRYEVRVRRSNPTDTENTRIRDDLVWGELKAVLESDAIYDHTVWAVKVLVTGQLSGQSERKFNVMAQRLIDVWDGSQWLKNQPSRNPAWAFCDMVRAKYGGGYSDEYLDLFTIKTLAATWEIREDYFDYRFDTKGTLDRALQLICRAGRAVKVEYDGVYSIVRDAPKLVADYQFGMTEIISGSLKIQYLTQDQWADDSVEVSYIDNETGQPHTILCALPGKTSLRPRKLKLEGVTTRKHAYREGMFEAARAEYRNRIATYKTELAGGLVDYGSCVSLSHVMSNWGTSGEVESTVVDGLNIRLTLSEPVEFKSSEQHVIQLADIRNQPQGPFLVTPGDDAHEVIMSAASNAQIYTGFKRKRTGFQFGVAEQQSMRFIQRSITPEGDVNFSLSGEYDDPIVHTFDDLINDGTLPLPEPPTIFNKDLERVRGLRIAFTGSYSVPVINITWSPVDDAERYVLQVSRDAGVTWFNLVSTSDLWYKSAFDKSVNRLRIAAMSDLVGPWSEKEISLSVNDKDRLRPNAPTGLMLVEPFLGLSCKIKWDEQLDAKRWRLSVCNAAGEAKRTIGVTNPEYSYSAEEAKADGSGRNLLFKIWAENDHGDHSFDHVELAAKNPQIGALTNITGSDFIDTAQISASTPNAVDFEGFIVWMSPDKNFTVNDSLIVSMGSRGPVLSFPIPESEMYAKIAGYDAWGHDELTVSSEITFTRPLIDKSQLAQDLRAEITSIADQAKALAEIGEEVLAVDQKIESTKSTLEDAVAESFSAVDSRITDTEQGIEAQAVSLEQIESRVEGAENESGLLAVVATEAKTTANAALGKVNAQLTFKVASRDLDGTYRMAGFGLSANNEKSRVIVYADKFGIMHPGAGSALAFAIENGRTVIPNAAIGSLAVKDANIESLSANKIVTPYLSALSANLGFVEAGLIASEDGESFWNLDSGLARFRKVIINGHIEAVTGTFVNTVNIAGHAVSYGVDAKSTTAHVMNPGNSWQRHVLSMAINLNDSPQSVVILVNVNTLNSGGATNISCGIKRNGHIIGFESITHLGEIGKTSTFMFTDGGGSAGARSYEIWLGNDWTAGGSPVMVSCHAMVKANMR